MIVKYHRTLLLLGTALSLGMAAPALAQTSASPQPSGTTQTAADDAQEIEQVIVTATRREERLQDVPISITVFNQTQLSNHNVVNAADLATYTPSLGVNTDFGSQNTSFAIRGFTQDIGTQPTVGVFFADVVAPRGPTQGTQAGDGAGPGDFFDLQSAQVLKGPQGTLFGINTTGGDVLLVPNKPTDEFGGYVQASFGNYDMKGAQGVLNIPVSDHIRLRFGIDHESRDGYLKNTSGIGPNNFDDENYTAVRASADIDVTSDIENYTIATYTESDTNGDFQKMIACDPTAAGSLFTSPLLNACSQLNPKGYAPPFALTPYQGGGFYDAAQSDPDAFQKSFQWRVINTTTWTASDNLTVKNIASYARFRDRLNLPLFGTNFYTPDLTGFGLIPSYSVDFANESLLPGGVSADQDTYTEEFQLQGHNFDNRLTWQAGLYLEGSVPVKASGYQSPVLIACTNPAALQCVDPVGYLLGLEGAVPFGTPIGSVNYTVGETFYDDYAGYAQGTYKLTDEIKLTGGIRYTQDRETNTSTQKTYYFPYPGVATPPFSICTFPDAPADCTRNFEQKSQAPTWLLDVDYTPSDETLIYGKYARGYRSGVIVQNIVSPFNNVGPEKVDDYEVGWKQTFEGWLKGTFDVDGFYEDFANQQLLLGFDTNPCYKVVSGDCEPAPVSPTAAPVNAGKSHIFGTEIDSTIIPYPGVTLNLSYTYLYTRLIFVRSFSLPPTSDYIIAGAQQVGDTLPLSPRDKISLSASYTLPIDDKYGKVTFGATFVHTDRQLTNYIDRNAVPVLGAGGSVFSSMSYLQPTDLLDINASWENIASKPVDLVFFATNVTGEKYYSWIPGLATDTGFETAEVGQPTMYGVRLTYHFGNE